MSVKTFAPKGFKFKGLEWRRGRRYCSPEELAIIKTVPHTTPILDRDGKVLNPPPKVEAPKASSTAKTTQRKKGTTHASKSSRSKS